MAEYVVTVKKDANWKELHDELCRDTSADSSVDSSIVPDREVVVVKEKPDNIRNTHYELSDEEAEKLKADNRILAIEDVAKIPPPKPKVIQEGNFGKWENTSGQWDNWGLLRHISKTNNFGNAFTDPGGSYDYVLDGTGVDVVIMDTGIQVGHPEWKDKNGATRLKQINWYTAAGRNSEASKQSSDFYTDSSTGYEGGHGTHCAGTVAGKNFGWAKNADIYCMTSMGSYAIADSDQYDLVRQWHVKKNTPGDPSYTGRPTVVNMSFGYGIYFDATNEQIGYSDWYDITGGVYRGSSHSQTSRNDLKNKGFTNLYDVDGNIYQIPYRIASVDTDITQMIDAGIHVCIASGNEAIKIDAYGGPDWDNYLTVSGSSNRYYYNRGSSPSGYETGSVFTSSSPTGQDTTPAATFMVGAMGRQPKSSTVEAKAIFSNSGPGVDIYAAGEEIISCMSNVKGVDYWDYENNQSHSTYQQEKEGGTSMAAPQISGMVACLLQAHPDWTPKQVKDYFLYHSQPTMHDSGNDADWTDTKTIHGGNNRTAYFPMHGKKPFSFG